MPETVHLAVPHEHLDVLVEPAPLQISAALATDATARLARTTILERPLSGWREDLRRRLDLPGRVIATGHQAEFFHAGVLAKTIATHLLALRHGAAPIFLLADSDLPKSTDLTVPEITAAGLRAIHVALPACDTQRAAECQPAAPRTDWLDFFVRVASLHEHYEASFVRTFADAFLAGDEPRLDFCQAISRGWSAVEAALGLGGVRHLRLSALCETPEFRALAAYLILHAPRVARTYNAAQAAYRKRHRIHNERRPIPPLAVSPDRTELPLWVFRCAGPRQRMHACDRGNHVELYAGQERIADLPREALVNPDRLARPWPFEEAGWRIRPRALTLSAFVRLLLADLFVQGIGGAQYDEITDEWLRGLLEIEPPPICCVSATVHLPLPRTGVRREAVLAARHACRDLLFNPQRYVRDVPAHVLAQRTELLHRSDALRTEQPRDRTAGRMVFDGIRRLNEQILAGDPWRASELDQQARSLAERYELDRIASGREYFGALHLKTTLMDLVARMAERFETA